MAGEGVGFAETLTDLYNDFLFGFSAPAAKAFNLFIVSVLIVFATIIIFKFFKSISQKDILKLNLAQYNTSEHPFFKKFYALSLYFAEYIVIMPLIIMLWFALLSVMMSILVSGKTIDQVLLISGATIAAIRILAYHKQEMAQELAKLFPLIAISAFLLSPNAFDVPRMISQIADIPLLFESLFYFLIVIFMIEIVLRIFYTIMEFWQSEDE